MTLKELIDVSYCEAFEVVIRDHGCGKWIYAYKIGEKVEVGKYDYYEHSNGRWEQSGRFFTPDKEIEVGRHDGKCKCLIIPKPISKLPKKIWDLQVAFFRYGIVVEKGIDHSYDCLAIDCFPEGFDKEEVKKNFANAKENFTDEQMTLF